MYNNKSVFSTEYETQIYHNNLGVSGSIILTITNKPISTTIGDLSIVAVGLDVQPLEICFSII